jgi:hypothetical protein
MRPPDRSAVPGLSAAVRSRNAVDQRREHAGGMRGVRVSVGRIQPTRGHGHDKCSPFWRRSLAGHTDHSSADGVRTNQQNRPGRRDPPVVMGSAGRRHVERPHDRHHSHQRMRQPLTDRTESQIHCAGAVVSYKLARSSGTSTLCSRSTSRGTTSRVRSWVHASTTGAAQPSW